MKQYYFFLGIDPGLKNIGSTLLDCNGKAIDTYHILTPKVDSCLRFEIIASYFKGIPNCCVCYERQRNLVAAEISIALGYILCTVRPSCIIPVAPKQLKKWLCGSGKASKEDVMLEVQKQLGVDLANDHIADSAACALYAFKKNIDTCA